MFAASLCAPVPERGKRPGRDPPGRSGVYSRASMAFSRELLTILVILALGLVMLALFLLATVAGPKRRQRAAAPPRGGAGAALEEQAVAVRELEARVAEADAELRQHLARTVQRVALIRYDAFEDMGGHLSFSLALLDEAGNGVVVSAINGRQDTRVYAKPVVAGGSEHNLSHEEADAIRQAMASSPAVSA